MFQVQNTAFENSRAHKPTDSNKNEVTPELPSSGFLPWRTAFRVSFKHERLSLSFAPPNNPDTGNGYFALAINYLLKGPDGGPGQGDLYNMSLKQHQRHMSIEKGVRVSHINDQALEGIGFTDAVTILRNAGRPVILRFINVDDGYISRDELVQAQLAQQIVVSKTTADERRASPVSRTMLPPSQGPTVGARNVSDNNNNAAEFTSPPSSSSRPRRQGRSVAPTGYSSGADKVVRHRRRQDQVHPTPTGAISHSSSSTRTLPLQAVSRQTAPPLANSEFRSDFESISGAQSDSSYKTSAEFNSVKASSDAWNSSKSTQQLRAAPRSRPAPVQNIDLTIHNPGSAPVSTESRVSSQEERQDDRQALVSSRQTQKATESSNKKAELSSSSSSRPEPPASTLNFLLHNPIILVTLGFGLGLTAMLMVMRMRTP